jgi:hypothetical protein
VTAPAAARVDFGSGYYCGLHRTPRAMPVTEPGKVTLILGELPSGRPLLIEITDLAWLASLESAIQVAIGEGVIEAGMTLAVRP